MRRLAGWLFVVPAVVILGIGGIYSILERRIAATDFKLVAEERLSEILRTKVHIGKIKPRFFNRVILDGLEIEPGGPNPLRLEAGRVVFRYGWRQFLTRDFKIPETVIFEAPKIIVDEQFLAFPKLDQIGLGGSKGSFSDLSLSGGEIRYAVPFLASRLSFQNVQGKISSNKRGLLSLDIKAVAGDGVSGEISAAGEIDLAAGMHLLEIRFKQVDFGESMPIGLSNLNGLLRIEKDKMFLRELRAESGGWKTVFDGSVERLFEKPLAQLTFSISKRDLLMSARLVADLGTNTIRGRGEIPVAGVFDFEGSLFQDNGRFLLRGLRVNQKYSGEGDLDFATGLYGISLENERERFVLSSSMKKLEFNLSSDINHLRVFGLDLVARVNTRLKPAGTKRSGHSWKFDGDFDTDYFIVEQEPFDDFRGKFTLDRMGIRDLDSAWGMVFGLGGDLFFGERFFNADLLLRVNGFDLAKVRHFAARPLPKELRGSLEGKLKIQGNLKSPEVLGRFSIKQGKIGRLEYDRGLIRFRGIPPYLPLEESRILKGRTRLDLKGALDLSLKNPFHGVSIETLDKLVVWKGIFLNTSQEFRGIEISSKELPLSPFSFHAEQEGSEGPYGASGPGFRENRYGATVGPKIKF